MILDDLILDITNYKFVHPGGVFTIQYNVGRDISKFFYGGYQLENRGGRRLLHTHHSHSALAMMVAKKMAVGVLNDKAKEFLALVDSKQTVKHTSVHTFLFRM